MYKIKWNYSKPTQLFEPIYYWNIISQTQLASKRQIGWSRNTMWLYMYYSAGHPTPTQSAQAIEWRVNIMPSMIINCIFGSAHLFSYLQEFIIPKIKGQNLSTYNIETDFTHTFPPLSLLCFALSDYAFCLKMLWSNFIITKYVSKFSCIVHATGSTCIPIYSSTCISNHVLRVSHNDIINYMKSSQYNIKINIGTNCKMEQLW